MWICILIDWFENGFLYQSVWCECYSCVTSIHCGNRKFVFTLPSERHPRVSITSHTLAVWVDFVINLYGCINAQCVNDFRKSNEKKKQKQFTFSISHWYLNLIFNKYSYEYDARMFYKYICYFISTIFFTLLYIFFLFYYYLFNSYVSFCMHHMHYTFVLSL